MSVDPKSSYYDAGDIETIEIIKAKLTPEQYHGYLLGNSIKYMCRVNFKTPDSKQRDSEKAAMYAKLFNQAMEQHANNLPNFN